MSNFLPSSVANVNRLTLSFLKAVGREQTDQHDNLIVSPYNALTCLSMVAKGAASTTREEMAQTLFGVDAATLYNSAATLDNCVIDFSALNKHILAANQGKVILSTANGIWFNNAMGMDDDTTLNTDFASDLRELFDAKITTCPFTPATVKDINNWSDESTKGLIKELLTQLSPQDMMVLASSLYFKGDWTSKFDKALTKDRGFTADDGTIFFTPTMQQDFNKKDILFYQSGTDYESVALCYGPLDPKKGIYPSMRLVLIRPKDARKTARDWLIEQAGQSNHAWLNTSYNTSLGTVELPRLDMKQKHDLIPPLKAMGMQAVFGSAAHLGPMTEQISRPGKFAFVSKVSHDVVFKTDEEGSEAAAVTAAVVMRGISFTPRVNVKFDRSFAFAMQDTQTGAVLFAGAVNKPNGDMKPAP